MRIVIITAGLLFVASCGSPEAVTPVAALPDRSGCVPPEPGTLGKLGIDASLLNFKYQKVAIGALSVKTDPQVVDLLAKATRDASVRSYLTCKAIKEDSYNQEQAAYLNQMNAFMATGPSPDQFMQWQDKHPFPRTVKLTSHDVTACDHLSVTAAWDGLQAPERTEQCSYSAPDKCSIAGTRVITNSDNGGSQSTNVAPDHKSLTAVLKAKPDGSAIDRKRTWIDISVIATLQCEE
jgi:hypothetical protein